MSDDTLPVPLATFAATLRPRLTENRAVRPRRGGEARAIPIYAAGHPDEIWLKMLQIEHRLERHTEAQWHGLIEYYRKLPAHPADPNYVPR